MMRDAKVPLAVSGDEGGPFCNLALISAAMRYRRPYALRNPIDSAKPIKHFEWHSKLGLATKPNHEQGQRRWVINGSLP
ncbi:hypothetical protein [Azospirillum himalayense]|uniref:Uncharacterized protein n=1 Tax=Azospirillum himalayense TaxID=654847 RepID=A0ABW0FY69_9PROT